MSGAAIVLAGGQSRRMGGDKAMLQLHGTTLLARVVATLVPTHQKILVVAAPDQVLPQLDPAHVKILRDKYPGKGPLGGIYTGLTEVDAEYCPMVACDMPFASPSLLAAMVRIGIDGTHEAVIPQVKGRLQYLHAVYARRLAPAMEEAILRDRLALHAFLEGRRVQVIEEQEVAHFDPTLRFALNINTFSDLEEARRLLERPAAER